MAAGLGDGGGVNQLYDITNFFFDVLKEDFCVKNDDGYYEMEDFEGIGESNDITDETHKTLMSPENSEPPNIHKEGSSSEEASVPKSQPKRTARKRVPPPQSQMKKKTGRWTPDEHLKFLEALKMYGKDWDEIEKYIGTREITNIRSHA